MKQKTRDILPGELFFISSGEYSDYQVTGLFRCKKLFNPDDEAQPFIKPSRQFNSDHFIDVFNETAYISHLVKNEFLEIVPVFDFHPRSYSRYEPTIYEVGKDLI